MSRFPSRLALAMTVLLATLWWSTGPVHQAHAATNTVTNCTDQNSYLRIVPGTLRDAVDNAAAGDTITACSGTMGMSGGLALDKNLTIDGSGQAVTIDGGGVNGACGLGIFAVENHASVTLRDLTIANCQTGKTNSGSGEGAVIVLPGHADHLQQQVQGQSWRYVYPGASQPRYADRRQQHFQQ